MSVPTLTPPQQQQSRRSGRTLWIMVGTLVVLAVIGLAAIVGLRASSEFSSEVNSLKQTGSIPTRYYLTIMSGDYTTAYSYLDKSATINGQPVDQQVFTSLAKAADSRYGTVSAISFSTESDAAQVTATVTRGGSHSYIVHLVLQQENGTWKIVSADGI
jgi:flagellar basal body-associated protein FliL